MKKVLSLALVAMLAFGLVACGAPAEEETSSAVESEVVETVESETTESEATEGEEVVDGEEAVEGETDEEATDEEATDEEATDEEAVEGFMIKFANASPVEVTEIYVTVDAEAGYGENLLVDGATLAPVADEEDAEAPSQETTINLDSESGEYTIKFVNADGEEFEFDGFELENFSFFQLNEDGRYSAM